MKGSINRLVDTSKHILHLLSNDDTNVNQIIKQTSSDRTYVINVIKTLQQEGLVSERIEGKLKKKIQSLTELGRKIAKMIKLVQSCYELCDALKHDHPLDFRLIPQSPEKYLIRLQNMEPDGKNRIGIAILNHAAADYVRDFVIFKYVSLLRKYDLSKKKTTGQIFEQIISDATIRQMDAIRKGIVWTADPAEFIADFGEHATKIANLPDKMWRYGLLSNKFSGKEKAKEALLSVLPMLKSERESILQSIKTIDTVTADLITAFQRDIRSKLFSAKSGLEEAKQYPKEGRSERERDALYEQIWKALS